MTVIAIDGPAGSGKSTVAKAVAARLGIEMLDTGAMYRSVCFAALSAGIDLSDSVEVGRVAREVVIEMSSGLVIVNGVNATQSIRSPEVSAGVSVVAAYPEVRVELRRLQRQWLVDHGGGVLEGRDIGTVVAPDADVKVFLVADPAIRAQRRAAESGADVSVVRDNIETRDRIDSTRSDSPLVASPDAVVIDTSTMTIEAVVDEIERLVNG